MNTEIYYTALSGIAISDMMNAVELTDYKDSESGQNNQNIADEQEEYNR